MSASIVYRLMQALLLVLAQGFILNHVNVMGYATPMPYLLVLLTFQQDTGRKTLLLWGFILGLICDLFTNTPGISAASCTLIGMLQPQLLEINLSRDSADNLQPSFSSMGVLPFIRYLLMSTLIFQAAYYLLLLFSLAHPADAAINIVGGTLFSVLLMLGIACFHRKKA